mgnify:FL=1
MLTEDYIVGLVDGEGSFTVYIRDINSSKEVKRRIRAEPKFYVKLIERDKIILEELRNYFGCGNVYFQKDSRQNHQNCYRFEVTSRSDLKTIIIPFFKKHKLKFPSKQKDFELFYSIFKRIERNEHLQSKGLQKLYALKQHMH